MKTSKEVEEEFKKELRALLVKYRANIEIEGEPSCEYIECYIEGEWNGMTRISNPVSINFGYAISHDEPF